MIIRHQYPRSIQRERVLAVDRDIFYFQREVGIQAKGAGYAADLLRRVFAPKSPGDASRGDELSRLSAGVQSEGQHEEASEAGAWSG